MKKLHLFITSALALGAVGLACTGRVEIGSGPGADAGPSPDDAAPSPFPGDAAPSPFPDDASPSPAPRDASLPPTPADASLLPRTVTVLLHHDRLNVGLPPFIASTLASSGGVLDSDPACATTTFGACTVQEKRCSALPGTETIVGAPRTLVFSGAAFPSPMNLNVIVPGGAAQFGSLTPWWTTGGETVDISASATAESPAFAVQLPTPSDATVAFPTAGSTSAPLVMGWTIAGAPGGEIQVQLNRRGPGGSTGPFVSCRAAASAGTLSVPAAAMAALGPGTHQMFASSSSQATTTVGGTKVVVAMVDSLGSGDVTVP